MHKVIILVMDRSADKVKCSYGIGYPICHININELHNLRFIGDYDDHYYEAEVSDKIYKRLTR